MLNPKFETINPKPYPKSQSLTPLASALMSLPLFFKILPI